MKDHLKNKHSENGDEQESQNPYMKNLALSILSLVTLLLLAACNHQPTYPQQLVEADSAMRWGRYHQADSLLQAYGKTRKTEKNAIRRYHQLLTLESKFLQRELNVSDILLADTLRSFFEKSSLQNHSITLAVIGDIYSINSDYPSALDHFLQAEKEAKEAGILWLQGIICKEEGDIYLDQRMFNEMTDYFRRSYNLAYIDKDTLRMANAAIRMGKVHTYLENVDSIIFYYKKAIEFGKEYKHNNKIIKAASFDLADIYLQIEEFDKALSIMSRDTLDDVNWAYWHYQQNHTDSAIYYFQKALSRYNYYADAEYYSILSELEEKRGNQQQAITYLKKCIVAKDSVQAQSQKEATLKTAAQYNLTSIKEELNRSEQIQTYWEWGIKGLLLIGLLAILLGHREWKRQQRDKENTIAREQQLRQEAERQHRQSRHQIEENKKRILQLEKELANAQKQNDRAKVQLLELDAEQLRAENASIEAVNERREHLLKEFQESLIYQRIIINAGKEKFHLRDEEWEKLSDSIDKVYDNFTGRLLALTPLNETERQICYLLKLNLKPTQIATMLCLSDTAISMNRNRLYKKIFHEKGSSKLFDEFIRDF